MGADLIRRPLARHTSGQRTQGFLAHIIFQRADMRVDAIQRTNADYPPPIPGSHVRKHSFHCPESGPEIHGKAVLHLSIRLVLRATETTPAPCILTRMSTLPNRFTVSSIMPSSCARSRTSVGMHIAEPPKSLPISSATASPFVWLSSAITTFAPSRA